MFDSSLLFTFLALVIGTILVFGLYQFLFSTKSSTFSSSSSSSSSTSLSKRKSNITLLLGLPNSGKTTFFYRCLEGKFCKTVTSVSENEATFSPQIENSTPISIHCIDIPGTERLRVKFFQYLPQTIQIIYFLDSMECSSDQQAITKNAEFLFDILTNEKVVKRRIPIFVCCNKSDIAFVSGTSHFQKKLEIELEKKRQTKQSSQILEKQQSRMNEEDDENRKSVPLLLEDSIPFSFEQYSKQNEMEIEFISCSLLKNYNIDTLLCKLEH